ncbi:hypothetical protein B0H63DRAFT_520008 [Podospora didyma]|uniref:Uncharacterized protein n=1 Tax=Podospora didyma TaxID=330526 RepID=A0AAE0P010_9PEZI|nr:hypothetical protein B0H63DRAFT_520008 [Podospora didyma]
MSMVNSYQIMDFNVDSYASYATEIWEEYCEEQWFDQELQRPLGIEQQVGESSEGYPDAYGSREYSESNDAGGNGDGADNGGQEDSTMLSISSQLDTPPLFPTTAAPIRPQRALNEFTFKGLPFPSTAKPREQCVTPLDATAWILEQLVNCHHDLTEKSLVGKTEIKRLFRPRIITVNGVQMAVDLRLETPQRTNAIALFLTCEQTNRYSCQSCSHKNSKGPMEDCVAPGKDLIRSACTNCYYIGTGKNCSIRRELEKGDRSKDANLIWEKFPMLDKQSLDAMPMSVVKRLAEISEKDKEKQGRKRYR